MKAVVKTGVEIFKGLLHASIIPLLIIYKGGNILGWWSLLVAFLYVAAVFFIYEYLELNGIHKYSRNIFIAIVVFEVAIIFFLTLNIASA